MDEKAAVDAIAAYLANEADDPRFAKFVSKLMITVNGALRERAVAKLSFPEIKIPTSCSRATTALRLGARVLAPAVAVERQQRELAVLEARGDVARLDVARAGIRVQPQENVPNRQSLSVLAWRPAGSSYDNSSPL